MLIKQLLFAASVIVPQLGAGSASAQTAESPYVRLAELEIDPAQIERFNASIREEIEASIRAEPGVLTLYAVSVKDEPSKIRVFEMYVDAPAYAAHLQTPHFRKFKAETQDIVKSLKLFDAIPVALGARQVGK
jgi:quinol monooxygenase YgiN